MALELNGTTGVSLVQDGVITDANLPAGSVLQVVQVDKDTETATSSTSYVDLGLSASITPSSTSSKILVLFSGIVQSTFNAVDTSCYIGVFKDSDSTPLASVRYEQRGITRVTFGSVINFLHSPSTTSSVTYSIKGKVDAQTVKLNDGASNQGCAITLMEIAG